MGQNTLEGLHFKKDEKGFYSGDHLILEMYECQNTGVMKEWYTIEGIFREMAEKIGATVLNIHTHSFGEGMGVAAVAILAESHISIHTWPEIGYAALDCFVCGENTDPKLGIPSIVRMFEPIKTEQKILRRGNKLSGKSKI